MIAMMRNRWRLLAGGALTALLIAAGLARARRLGAGRVIGLEEMEKSQTEQRVAKASREQAEMEAQATLASARLRQAQVETARQRLVDTRVLAPAPSPGRLPPGCSPG